MVKLYIAEIFSEKNQATVLHFYLVQNFDIEAQDEQPPSPL